MARPKKSNILDEFERKNPPDKKALAELTKRAIGGRKAADFAALCGVNASTISRIVNPKQNSVASDELNKRLQSSISDDLLVAIAANAESDNGGIFAKLIQAQGLVPKSDAYFLNYDDLLRSKLQYLSYYTDSYGASNYEQTTRQESTVIKNARDIVQSVLIDEEFQVSKLRNLHNDVLPRSILAPFQYDFALKVTPEPGGESEIWIFAVLDGSTANVVSHLERMLCAAYLSHPNENQIHMFAVLLARTQYEQLKNALQGRTAADSISLMLLDIYKRDILDQFDLQIKSK